MSSSPCRRAAESCTGDTAASLMLEVPIQSGVTSQQSPHQHSAVHAAPIVVQRPQPDAESLKHEEGRQEVLPQQLSKGRQRHIEPVGAPPLQRRSHLVRAAQAARLAVGVECLLSIDPLPSLMPDRNYPDLGLWFISMVSVRKRASAA